ncbi:BLUF domain-containing protein [uncultured Methylobacterium sp.]|uniref:BLUF domain-containing protein n=1 Tax=uncultured Methylobacterium sp. TaxID=157278 RepID=UPI0035CC3680
MTSLYRLVYASKNLLRGSESEIAAAVIQILETSQRNNAKVDVTGALMFNAGAFAQVLEGPRRAVEATFERIQRDERHTDVTVLQCGPAESRGFPNWSMAFVGQSATGHALWHSLAADSGFDLARLDGDQIFTALHSLILEEEIQPAAAGPASVAPADASGVGAFDVDRVRAELAWPGQAASTSPSLRPAGEAAAGTPQPFQAGSVEPSTASVAALAVFKAALADERQRTTDLRNDLDDLRVALAASHARAERLIEERDLWARRARLMASALGHEAEGVGTGAEERGGSKSQSAVGGARGCAGARAA